MNKLPKSFISFKNNLTKIKQNEQLGILSLIVIIFLDIFVLSVIFTGLTEHTSQLTSPRQYAPQVCQEIFIDRNWSSENEIDKLQSLVLFNYDEDLEIKRMHAICQKLCKSIALIKSDSQLNDLLERRSSLQRDSEQLNQAASKARTLTQNTFLSNISEKENHNNHPTIMATSKAQSDKLETISSEIDKINLKLYNHPEIKDFLSLIHTWDKTQEEDFRNDIESFKFWYKYKEFSWQMLFLIPLFFIIYLWNHISIKKEHGLQLLISSHLLIVITIPIFLQIINLVLELIPQYFFKKLFETLKAMHLVAIWHYALILLSVIVTLFLIYIIQKKLFNKKRLQEKRFSNSACIECGRKLPKVLDYCPFCGAQQVEECSVCQSKSFICGDFCSSCGHKKESIK